MLATTAIQTDQKASTAVAVLIPVIALGLPIMDTLLAMARRAVRGRPLFRRTRSTSTTGCSTAGLSHRQAVLVLYGLCVLLGALALVLTFANSGQSALLLVVLALVAFVFLRSLGYVRLDRDARSRRRPQAKPGAARRAASARPPPAQAAGTDEIWPLVVEAAKVSRRGRATLQRRRPDCTGDRPPPRSATRTERTHRSRLFVSSSSSRAPRPAERTLELGWRDGRREIDRDTEIALEIFCEYLGEALDAAREPAPQRRRPRSGARARGLERHQAPGTANGTSQPSLRQIVRQQHAQRRLELDPRPTPQRPLAASPLSPTIGTARCAGPASVSTRTYFCQSSPTEAERLRRPDRAPCGPAGRDDEIIRRVAARADAIASAAYSGE